MECDALKHRAVPCSCSSLTNTANIGQVPLSEQWLVQGELFYRLEGVDRGEEEDTDFVVVDLPRIQDGSSTSGNVEARKSVALQVSTRC